MGSVTWVIKDKEEAKAFLEAAHRNYLKTAREVAHGFLKNHDFVTVRDVVEIYPVPPSIDKRVLGALFNHEFKYVNSIIVEDVGAGRKNNGSKLIGRWKDV